MKKRQRMAVEVQTLERRVLLAGVTLITHGWEGNSNRPSWLDSMADAIVARAGSGTSVYDMQIARNSSGTSPSVVSFSLFSGPGFSNSSNAEAVVMLDWADASGVGADDYFNTAGLAPLAAYWLTHPDSQIDIDSPLASVPIHLIGHSRGGSLVSELAKDLGQQGIWVNQLTTLDPEPVKSDPQVAVYNNVAFADNYYQTDEIGFHGSSVTGAHDINLSGVFHAGFGDHSDVHAYYDGTIDQYASNDGDGIDISDDWYNYSNTGPRDAVGFNWTSIGGGSRPSDGLSSAFGGSVSRPSVPDVSGTQWANIDDVTLTDSGSQFEIRQPLHATFRYEDANYQPTITLYLDSDQSPFDGAGYQVEQSTRTSGASVYSPSNPLLLDTSNVPAGQYYLYAKITDGVTTRYAYDTTPITLVAPTPPSISGIVYNDITGDGITADDTRVSGMPINLYQSDGTTLITTTTSASDGSFSFDNLTPGGSYVWRQAVPSAWTATVGIGGWSESNVLNDKNYTGNFADFQNISISGAVFNDLTGNSFSTDDTLLGGVTLDLYQNGGSSPIQTTDTGSTGFYSFNNLGPGAYSVQEVVPSGWTVTGGGGGYNLPGQSGQNFTDEDFDNTIPPPPAIPTSLTATAISTSQISLSWTDPANDETGFYIDRWSDADQKWIQIGSTISPGYLDSYLMYGTTYSYEIRAYNASGASAFTPTASATTKGYVPDLSDSFWYTTAALPPGGKKNKVGVEVKNAGNLRINAEVPINLYASADQSYDSSDSLIASISTKLNISAGSSKFVTLKFNSPSNVPGGNYYLLAYVNPLATAAESDYGNNVAAADSTTSIQVPDIDLSPGFSAPSHLFRGSRTKTRVTITNYGNVSVIASSTVVMSLTPDDSSIIGESILGSMNMHLKLKPGQSRSFNMGLFVPLNASGNYLAVVLQDSGISDSDLGNNTAFSADTITLT